MKLAEKEIKWLIGKAKLLFDMEPTLLEIRAPVNITGDFHGQYYDLLRMYDMLGGPPPHSKYLHMGDYVDRGKQSIETICLLLAYKVKYPDHIFLLRGNHECSYITRMYGFYNECQRRYSLSLWKEFCSCFNSLPLAAIVDERILCMHGGLSPEID